MSNLFDTQELNEIRKLIGEDTDDTLLNNPEPPIKQSKTNIKTASNDSFDLDKVLSNVNDVLADELNTDTASMKHLKSSVTRMSGGTARLDNIPRVTGSIQPGTGRISQNSSRLSQNSGRISQASQRIPRMPGVDPAEIEKNMQDIANKQARHLQKLAEDDEREQIEEKKLSRKEKARLAKERRKEDERLRDMEENETSYNLNDLQRQSRKRAKNLARRSGIILILTIICIYITIGSGMGLPLPSALQYAKHTFLTIMILMILQFLSMFVAIDIVGNSIYNLFKARPDRSTLVVFSLIASLLHGMSIILFKADGFMPYCAISMVLLFAEMQEEKARAAGQYRAYKAAGLADVPTYVYSHYDKRVRTRCAVKYESKKTNEFQREMVRTDLPEKFERFYVPFAILLSIVLAALTAANANDPIRFFWAFSAILSISAPLGIICGYGIAYRNISRKLLSEGAALPSARQAGSLSRVKQSILSDSDLFPAGSITLDKINNYGNYTTEKLLAYALAVTEGHNLEISRVFSEALHEKYGRPVKARNIVYYESGGMSADIEHDNVLVGTASFLSTLGINQSGTPGVANRVYIVINSQFAGEILLSYHPTAQTYGAVHMMSRHKIEPVICAKDFNISPAMVESMFELKHGTVDSVDGQRIDNVNHISYVENDSISALLSKDGIMPFAVVLEAADRLISAFRANMFIGTISGICGMLLMFYLTHKGAAEAVEPKNVLIYILLWYLPTFVVNHSTNRRY